MLTTRWDGTVCWLNAGSEVSHMKLKFQVKIFHQTSLYFGCFTSVLGSEWWWWMHTTSISAWISNHMSSEVWDEITYPFPKLQRCNRWNLGMAKYFHPTLYWECESLSMLRLKGTTEVSYSVRDIELLFRRNRPGYQWLRTTMAPQRLHHLSELASVLPGGL